MTCGELMTKTAEIVECREHDLLCCKECLESTARELGLFAWNMIVAKSNDFEEVLNELDLEFEERRQHGTH